MDTGRIKIGLKISKYLLDKYTTHLVSDITPTDVPNSKQITMTGN